MTVGEKKSSSLSNDLVGKDQKDFGTISNDIYFFYM